MEKVNAYAFYQLSRNLRSVAGLPDDALLVSAMWVISGAETALTGLIDNGQPIPLGVSLPQAKALRDAVAYLNGQYMVDDGKGGKKWEWPKEDARFPTWMLGHYRRSLETFETVFGAEMTEAATYFIPRKGIFFTPALVDKADETFPAELAPHIPKKSLDDWRSAGRCLAFNLLSASGFHIARAVEGILEAYYQTFTGKTGTENGWHDYIKSLEKVDKEPKPSTKTLAGLRQMKDDYRNPLMHPRVVLDESEARILFASGESLIMGMAREIKDAATLPLTGGAVTKLLAGGGLTA